MKNIVILGSTGTIGTQTLDVIKNDLTKTVLGLSANKNIELLEKQIIQFSPKYISIGNEKGYLYLKSKYPDITFFYGEEGLKNLATLPDAHLIVSAVVGFAGFIPIYNSLKMGKQVAIANKESIVAGGELLKTVITKENQLIPIDSEHVAIWQALNGSKRDELSKIIITASGGPFFRTEINELKNIKVEDALKHPNWKMGDKITIDSSTMMNKTFEIIEAFHFFDLSPNEIEVVIHPQSIVHSMVQFYDSSIIAQLGVPDMRIPISYSINYPDRFQYPFKSLDFSKLLSLEFYPLDKKRFPAIDFANEVFKNRDLGVIINAANEVAVDSFLKGEISWIDIYRFISETLDKIPPSKIKEPTDLLYRDQEIKKITKELIKKI
ncbi:1-deoxy-D-xylulose-5-phosphate reductoisomerase [bacterium]|nr:1-deoxy-D-xylulose-5-phosphate reductoisomerase [bacterium]